ncbi:MAG: M23 family metallopeptidase [Anaerolineaceae bacterium]|nr:M23 family metallopeptidase [Anaerolineaceae bacterium]
MRDHYVLERPIAAGATNWVDRTYPYGSTGGGRFPLHHGVEFVNARHTDVLAAASGSVHFAGKDSATQFGPTTDYYGNLVVLQHDSPVPPGKSLFTLYGHLESLAVATGQRVSTGDALGQVGDSGIANGPHLHFEVRVENPDSYAATRNPELWLRPFRGFGTLAGRVRDAAGNLLQEVTIRVRSTDSLRFAWSYAGDGVNGDDNFGENFVLGDLPANYYEITVGENGRILFRETIYVWPKRSNWLEIQLDG